VALIFGIVGLIGAGGIFGGLRVLGRKRTKKKICKIQDMFDRQPKKVNGGDSMSLGYKI